MSEPAPSAELTEQRSRWLAQLLSENPQLLALRERVLPWTGGHSFANIVHTDTTAVLAHINRHTVLELVYQHLMAIGMHKTAEKVKEESGHEFQKSEQPWDKTDLLLLVSLGVLPREDPWSIAVDPHHQFVEENLEEDFFASRYREDTSKLYEELLDRDRHVIWAKDSKTKSFDNMVAASLRYLVVFVATATNAEEEEDALGGVVMQDTDRERFFLILHSITSSYHFLEHLMMLFDCENLTPSMRAQLRKNIVNLLRKWIYFHGLFIGRKTIKAIGQFLRKVIDNPECRQGFDLSKIAKSTLDVLPKLTYGRKSGTPADPESEPKIPDPQCIFKPSLSIIDPDSEEVARQITLMFHKAFSAVHSREFMVALGNQRASHQTPTLAEFFDFSERLTLLCLETILRARDKEAAVEKILEIGKAMHEKMYNFAALAAIVRALDRREIEDLFKQDDKRKEKRTQYLTVLRQFREACGCDPSNQTLYNEVVKRNFSFQSTPTVPNLETELQVATEDKEEPVFPDLIAWKKRWSISEKTAMLYHFQNQPYRLWPIPQIQKVISRGPRMTAKQIEQGLADLSRGGKGDPNIL